MLAIRKFGMLYKMILGMIFVGEAKIVQENFWLTLCGYESVFANFFHLPVYNIFFSMDLCRRLNLLVR